MKTSSHFVATIVMAICTGCSVESVQCVGGKAYHFTSSETRECHRFSIENDKLVCYDKIGNVVDIQPKRPMKIAEYSKFKRKVDSDPLSGFVSSECTSSAISE